MIAAALLALAVSAQDPARVRAHLVDPEIHAGQTTVLRVEAETTGSRAQIQRFATLPPGLEVVATHDFDQRQFSFPGGQRRYVTREFTFRAAGPGRYRIPSVDVIVDGRTYSTEPQLLTVTTDPAAGGGPAGMDEHGVMLRAWTDADTVFVGEQVNLHVEAVFSQDARLRLRRAPEYEPPAPAGFWIHDIEDARAPVSRGTRGDVYETQTFRRAFFPISPGRYEIPPARLFYEMRRGVLQAPETFTVESDRLPLVVRPVPEEGRPASFTGAVGRYRMRASLQPERVAAGDAAILTVEIEGTGNVRGLPPPRLPELPGVDVFPPGEEAEMEFAGVVVRGVKRFTWVLVPAEAGAVTIPEIDYASFDPETRTFQVATAAPPALLVDAGAVAADAGAAQPAGLRYLRTAPGRAPPLRWTRSAWFAIAQGAPLLLLAGALLLRRWNGRDRRFAAGPLRRRRRALVRDLEAAAAADRADFAAADQAARAWLADRLGLDPVDASHAPALSERGVPDELAAAVAALFRRVEAVRFAPTPPAPQTRRDLLRGLARLLERIDKKAPRPRRRVHGRGRAETVGAAGAALLLLLAAPLDARPQDGPASFEQGTALFQDGRYADAAAAFHQYVRDQPDDPVGWYNLGTAHHRAGHVGRARWAWLNALRLDPRDADARHNLRVAETAPELVARVTPAVPLRVHEALLLASLAWFAGGVVGAWGVLRGRRGALIGATAFIAAALAFAAIAWQGARPTPILVVLEETALRAGPNLNAEALDRLAAGSVAVAIASQGAWIRARTPAGAEGWLEAGLAGRMLAP